MAAEILTERACRPLIREKDPVVRELAIAQIVKKASETPAKSCSPPLVSL